MSAIEKVVSKDPAQAFQDRILEKLRSDIGELMPPEVLRELFKRATEEAFFKPRTIMEPRTETWRDPQTKTVPPWFVEEALKMGEPLVKQAIQEFLEENKDRLREEVKKFCSQEKLLLLAVAEMRTWVASDIAEFAKATAQYIKQGY